MTTVMNPDKARAEILPMVLEMASDPVPNIRFNVAKALSTMVPICGNSVGEIQVRPVLSVLIEDPDRDVRFYAEKALLALDIEIIKYKT